MTHCISLTNSTYYSKGLIISHKCLTESLTLSVLTKILAKKPGNPIHSPKLLGKVNMEVHSKAQEPIMTIISRHIAGSEKFASE